MSDNEVETARLKMERLALALIELEARQTASFSIEAREILLAFKQGSLPLETAVAHLRGAARKAYLR